MRAALALFLLAVFATHPLRAAEPEFQLSPRFGHAELHIDAFEGVNEENEKAETINAGATAGFLTPIGIVFEGGFSFSDGLDFFDAFDEFNVSESFVALGYQAELGSGWRLVPKVGRARWKLYSEEGQLFNPGPEATTETRGYDYFWEVVVARKVSRTFALGFSYKDAHYDFGRQQLASFVMYFGF